MVSLTYSVSHLCEVSVKQPDAEIVPGMAMRPFFGIKPVLMDTELTGRLDDVINVSGHRIGTAEIEDVLEAVLSRQLNKMVSEKIAKYACPDFVQFAKRLPKTRSGKIMRRVLRKVVECDLDGLGDLSTLDDPGALQEILKGHEKLLSK
ncbi:hypothetical protein GOODEAATRI_021582 [Goodea atripinnis]|uniref:AMP-binding enzyme C-terminal domain-containing protein n=1 Tax=Goodea atripinnis TaxID=208336 RepID=A0ABV0Q0P6_9TELE